MKILIVFASAGAGHRKAAESIHKAFESFSSHSNCHVDLINILDFTNPFFKWSYEQTYLWMITRASWLWGIGYYWFDSQWMRLPIRIARRILNGLNSAPFCRYLQENRYDVILTTHFLASEVISHLKGRNKIQGRLATVITDLGAHAFWISPHIDIYVVGIEATRQDLIARGVNDHKIKVLGIPVRESFAREKDSSLIHKQIGLSKGPFTILLVGGGSGVGPIQEIVKELSSLSIQMLVVCGRNETLHQELIKESLGMTAFIKPFGYVENMDELMAVSDCIITKSGGLTVTEALASHLPMIIINPIPGQERKNCEVVVKAGAAIELTSPSQVRELVGDWMQNKEKLQAMKQRARELARPHAARDIAEMVVQLCSLK